MHTVLKLWETTEHTGGEPMKQSYKHTRVVLYTLYLETYVC